MARVLVQRHNRQARDAGLTLVGTLGLMAWLNDNRSVAVNARTHGIDRARNQRRKLAAPFTFLDVMRPTAPPFAADTTATSGSISSSRKKDAVELL